MGIKVLSILIFPTLYMGLTFPFFFLLTFPDISPTSLIIHVLLIFLRISDYICKSSYTYVCTSIYLNKYLVFCILKVLYLNYVFYT